MSEQLTNPAYVRILEREAQRAYRAYGKKTGGKNYQGTADAGMGRAPGTDSGSVARCRGLGHHG